MKASKRLVRLAARGVFLGAAGVERRCHHREVDQLSHCVEGLPRSRLALFQRGGGYARGDARAPLRSRLCARDHGLGYCRGHADVRAINHLECSSKR